METVCQLDYAVANVKPCPGDTCPLWVDDHCAVAGHWQDFGGDEYLAELLRDIRAELSHRDPSRAVRQFHPPGLA